MTTSLDISHRYDFKGNAIQTKDLDLDGNLTVAGTTTIATATPRVATLAASTGSLFSNQTGTIALLSIAAGDTVTLPAPVVGTTFDFYVSIVPSGGSYKIITNSGSVFLAGGIFIDKALTVTRYAADGTTIRSINLNGSTTGGATIGDFIRLTAVTATQWSVQGIVTASGTLATPFATS